MKTTALLAAAVILAAATACTNHNGDVSDLGADEFPCTLATHAEVKTVIGVDVVSHSVEPGGATCIYHYAASAAPGTFDIAVTDATADDQSLLTQMMEAYGPLTVGADTGARKLSGVGDLAFESQLPGYSGRVDFFAKGKEVQLTCDVPRRLTQAEFERLAEFAKLVATRV
jgi:hypothetical protein